ncbi:hypothetical protein H9L39_14823 [Fusarium oxysporum f. sp. albedinis]|nr:hypothetical protein H9L39_14823 [Fusarium oxysporum f. sp. albedinis]
MDKVRSRLKCKASVQVKTFMPWDHAKAWRIVASNYFEDASADIRKTCYAGSKSLEHFTEWILNERETSDSQAGPTLQTQRGNT